MKRHLNTLYILGMVILAGVFSACSKEDPTLFEGESDPSEFLAENYKATEDIYAGYVRWDQDFNSKLSMILGFRVENTNIDYTGNRVLDEEELEGEINTSNSYTNILPNLSFKYDIKDDLVLRAAFTTALARPNYYSLAPFVNNIASETEILAGNPELDATYSYNFDLMVEKYYKSVGLLTGGVFYKNLEDFIYTYSDNQYTTDKFAVAGFAIYFASPAFRSSAHSDCRFLQSSLPIAHADTCWGTCSAAILWSGYLTLPDFAGCPDIDCAAQPGLAPGSAIRLNKVTD